MRMLKRAWCFYTHSGSYLPYKGTARCRQCHEVWQSAALFDQGKVDEYRSIVKELELINRIWGFSIIGAAVIILTALYLVRIRG